MKRCTNPNCANHALYEVEFGRPHPGTEYYCGDDLHEALVNYPGQVERWRFLPQDATASPGN